MLTPHKKCIIIKKSLLKKATNNNIMLSHITFSKQINVNKIIIKITF